MIRIPLCEPVAREAFIQLFTERSHERVNGQDGIVPRIPGMEGCHFLVSYQEERLGFMYREAFVENAGQLGPF